MEKKIKIILIAVIIIGGLGGSLGIYYGLNSGSNGDGNITYNPCDLNSVLYVSKYGSCAGHPYPTRDSASSEKHYFRLIQTLYDDNELNVKLYAPWDCIITEIDDTVGEVNYGVQIHMTSGSYLGIFFHVQALDTLKVGMKVKAGDWIGYCDVPYADGPESFDFAIHDVDGAWQTPTYSFFNLMDDSTFAEWSPFGITTRDQVIIPESSRSCTSGWDNSQDNYIYLTH